ncbi:MAG: GreA/GreB family elongation factor, partial [Gammaproteobacteria bacterium]|nr:GreA/GreB family elongation factor [Gammaproteobacteria bacterium]
PSPPPPPTTRSTEGVSVGDTVQVRYVDGDQARIVMTITRERSDVDKGLVNMNAALAGALLDAEEGDEVEVLNGPYMRRAVIEKISKARTESAH